MQEPACPAAGKTQGWKEGTAMSDESNYETTAGGTTPPVAGTAERVGFCQDCGTPLTRETVRPVGAGVFCEPCLAARVGTATGYTTVPNAGAATNPMAGIDSTPHPVLAAFLGIIPGVGAMYNGQYAKGVAHLLIFAVLSSLGDHLKILQLLCFFWFCYQVVDAYQTAKARLEGRPLPNPFGLNEIGERMGFGKNWGVSPGAAAAAAGYAPVAGYAPAAGGPVAPGPVSGGPASNGPDWVGYVPPTNFASAPPVAPASQVPPVSQTGATWGHAPYAQTYTGAYAGANPATSSAAGADPYAGVPVPVVMPATARRFPAGAVWLIALGVLFLLAEFSQEWGWSWSLSGNWVLAALFAALAGWTLTRRLHPGVQVVCILRWPLVLATLAVMFALQALDIVMLSRTWPLLFIVFGVMLILERTALANMSYGTSAYPMSSVVPGQVVPGPVVPGSAEAEAERRRAAWAASGETQEPGSHITGDSGNDLTKSGGL